MCIGIALNSFKEMISAIKFIWGNVLLDEKLQIYGTNSNFENSESTLGGQRSHTKVYCTLVLPYVNYDIYERPLGQRIIRLSRY